MSMASRSKNSTVSKSLFGGWLPNWALVLLIVFAVVTISIRLTIVRLTYRITQTDKKITREQVSIEKKKIELARLKSSERLKVLAKTMGLVPPDSKRHVRLKASYENTSESADQTKKK